MNRTLTVRAMTLGAVVKASSIIGRTPEQGRLREELEFEPASPHRAPSCRAACGRCRLPRRIQPALIFERLLHFARAPCSIATCGSSNVPSVAVGRPHLSRRAVEPGRRPAWATEARPPWCSPIAPGWGSACCPRWSTRATTARALRLPRRSECAQGGWSIARDAQMRPAT